MIVNSIEDEVIDETADIEAEMTSEEDMNEIDGISMEEIEAGLDETSHMDDENMDEVSIELNESITNRFKKLAGILKS